MQDFNVCEVHSSVCLHRCVFAPVVLEIVKLRCDDSNVARRIVLLVLHLILLGALSATLAGLNVLLILQIVLVVLVEVLVDGTRLAVSVGRSARWGHINQNIGWFVLTAHSLVCSIVVVWTGSRLEVFGKYFAFSFSSSNRK